jgi:hypothetical protein
MNKEGHVLNAVLLGIGLGFVLEPAGDVTTFQTIAEVTVPITLGALFPDVDTAFGRHRKTFHNVFVLGVFLAFPLLFSNLQYVWIGVLTHYVLDLLGSKRGLALLYLLEREFRVPFGVPTASRYANVVTLLVTGLEVGLAALFLLSLPAALPATSVDVALSLPG